MTAHFEETQNDNSSLQQPWLEDFDQIRGFFDHEVPSSVSRLFANEAFTALLKEFLTLAQSKQYTDSLFSTFYGTIDKMRDASTIDELQLLINQIASPIIEMSISRFTHSGLDRLADDQPYLFISNHRDILMDPLLLNYLLYHQQHKTAHCAIGDNLLTNKIALEFAQLNKCFRVIRSLRSPRAILKAMKLQSAYIRHLSFNRQDNIWIAQKEGRSKDNMDKTNPALIKMLGLARPKEIDFGKYIHRLNIVPVSFSYEWDPCDIDKATELHITDQQGHYNKEAIEDLNAVKKGLLHPKGQVHIHFDDGLLGGAIKEMSHLEIADHIDQSIMKNSKIYPVNVAAFRSININETIKPSAFSLTEASIHQASEQLTDRLKACSDEIRQRVLLNYAAPLMR